MNDFAKLKAAAYAIAGDKGYSEAIRALSEMRNAQWNGR